MAKSPLAVLLDETSPSYATPDSAADEVSKGFQKQKNAETAAVIIQRPDGSYGYSTVAPQQTHDDFALRAQMQQGYKLAGIVHSHPGTDSAGQVFSPRDLDVANQLKVPSFVRFISDGSIRKYVPGVTKTQKMPMSGNTFGLNVAHGDDIIGDPDTPQKPPVVAASGALSNAVPPPDQPGALTMASNATVAPTT